MDSPNPLKVLRNIVRALSTTRRPNPTGDGQFDHQQFTPVLKTLATQGLAGIVRLQPDVKSYCMKLGTVDPDTLARDEALAYWINLYNAGSVALAIEAFDTGRSSVLRIPGAFSRPLVEVAGEELSLDAIEHGKIRRFRDPRIHGALVCGSLSCPTLRPEPYEGRQLGDQLDSQMKMFLEGGGASIGADGELELSRILLWFGPDFVRPHRMPAFLPTSRRRVRRAVAPWLPEHMRTIDRVVFQDYDWGLACAVR